MNEFDLEHYRTSWRAESTFGGPKLDPEQIEAMLRRESKSTTRQFRMALWLDIGLKGVAAAALLGLLLLYRGNGVVSLLHALAFAVTLFLTLLQWKTLRNVPPEGLAAASLRDCMRAFVRFYRGEFLRALYVGAVSGSLAFYVGVFYYSWLRYGGLRPLEADDYVVFVTGLLLAFGINAVAQRWQAGFQVRELEACLAEIDTDTLTAKSERQRRFRRRKITLVWLVSALLGLLLLGYFLST
jgi:hypothetical protein